MTLFGGVHLLLAPFPWQLRAGSVRMALTAPEMVVWWFVFFALVLPGLKHAIRHRFGDVMPLLLFLLLLSGVYSVTFGNVGTAYRQRAQLMPYLLIFAAIGLEQWKRPRTLRESLDHGSTETEEGPDDGPARPAPTPKRVAPWELSRAGSNPGDRPDTIGAISRPQLPMRTPRQRGTRNTIRIEPRTTLKSTEKEMKTDGKLPGKSGTQAGLPAVAVGPWPVLLCTGNWQLDPLSVNLRAFRGSRSLVQGLRALRGSSSQIPQRLAGAIECRT